jgi:hypothetical protein
VPEQKIPEWKMPEACNRKCQKWKIPELENDRIENTRMM